MRENTPSPAASPLIYLESCSSLKGVSFGFEPNEKCSYFYMPIVFHRPDYSTNKLTTTAATFVSTMIWDIDIESGKETEKTVNFTITSVKKSKKEV